MIKNKVIEIDALGPVTDTTSVIDNTQNESHEITAGSQSTPTPTATQPQSESDQPESEPEPSETPTEITSATIIATTVVAATATAEPTATTTEQATATSTIQPSITSTAIPNRTPSPTHTPTVSPTATSEARPTAVSPPRISTNIVYVQSNFDGHNLGLLKPQQDFVDDGFHSYAAAPAWSPDGSRLAFFGEGISQLGGIYQAGNGIWLIDEQGQNVRQLLAADYIKNMDWSPDGTKLALEVDTPNDPAQIVVINSSDGSELHRYSGQQPTWSPDSQKLVIKTCAPGCGLWLVNYDGSEAEQITFDGSDSFPDWSPDDQFLVFATQRDNDWEIYRLAWSDGTLLNLTNRPGTDITPAIDSTSSNIYFRTDFQGGGIHWRLDVVSINGGEAQMVREGVGPSNDWGLARPAVR